METINKIPEEFSELVFFYSDHAQHITGENLKEIFTNFYNTTDLSHLTNWINDRFALTNIKNLNRSIENRLIGDKFYDECDFKNALNFYNYSVILAPQNCDDFFSSVGKRSSALYELHNYEESIEDINLCLNFYSNFNSKIDLKIELLFRLSNCYCGLKLIDKAKSILNEILAQPWAINTDRFQIELELLRNKLRLVEIPTETCCDNIYLPTLKNGENPNFLSASNDLMLRYNSEKGRHVIAKDDLQCGDVLFVEKAFSFVTVENSDNKCGNCFKDIVAPVPCDKCLTIYCSRSCRDADFHTYHMFECTGWCVDIWPKIGVNFFALHLFLYGAATKKPLTNYLEDIPVESMETFRNDYEFLCSLVTNFEKVSGSDMLIYLMSACFLLKYLKMKTCFFHEFPEINEDLCGALILRHILQIVNNACTIEGVEDDFYEEFNKIEQLESGGHKVVGVGAFLAVAMMNHSCDTNVTNFFINNCIIVKANRDIKKGEEIFNCYGYHWVNQSTFDRTTNLKKQFHFDCTCVACTYPTRPEIFFDGILCQKCKGLALKLEENTKMYKCLQCNHIFNATNHFIYIDRAERLYKKYQKSDEDLALLQKCLEIREKVLYKYNYSLYITYLDFQLYYGRQKKLDLWWYYTKKTMEMDNELFGTAGLRKALNMRQILMIFLRFFNGINETNFHLVAASKYLELINITTDLLNQTKFIFSLHYPENMLKYDTVTNLLDKANDLLRSCNMK